MIANMKPFQDWGCRAYGARRKGERRIAERRKGD
jgi:hypothetical protein